MAAKSVSPASPLGEKHIFENQTVKLGTTIVDGRAFAEAGGAWPEIALESACGVPCAFRLDAGRLQIRYTPTLTESN